jgi:hypothetical protein
MFWLPAALALVLFIFVVREYRKLLKGSEKIENSMRHTRPVDPILSR